MKHAPRFETGLPSMLALAALFGPLLLGPTASAQPLSAEHALDAKQTTLFCGTDFTRLQDHAARPAAARGAQANSLPPEIGEEKKFRSQLLGPLYTFVLKDKSPLHYLWVEESELANVTDEMIAALHRAMVERTPEGSYNPDQGIIANLHELFGQPQNYDGDGIVDVLFLDLPGNLQGLVDVPEINHADVLYLDSRAFRNDLDFLQAAAAHEYTHLIHVNYMNLDDFPAHVEDGFLPEGLAQYGIIANGYAHAILPISYYRYADELARLLFDFRPRSEENFRWDYHRATLFHLYLAERYGTSVLRDILQNSVNVQGAANYESVLPTYGTTLADLLVDFHLANYLNDRALDARYGYATPGFEDVRIRDWPTSFALHEDGTAATATDTVRATMGPGSGQYFVWEHVKDLALSVSTTFPELLRILAVLERADGSVEIRPLEPGPMPVPFSGAYEWIAVAAIHTDPESFKFNVSLSASWQPATAVEERAEVPEAFVLRGNYPNPFNPATRIRYAVHRAGRVVLTIYDVLGQRVRTLVEGERAAGEHEVVWNGRDAAGAGMPSGVYVARMQMDGAVQSTKMMLVK